MSDPKDAQAAGGASPRPEEVWDEKVNAILHRVNRLATIYFTLGIITYGLGSTVLMIVLWSNPGIAGLAVMMLFQLMVLYFGSKVMFPCFSGAFQVGLLANRDTVPVFREMQESLEDAKGEMTQTAIDIRASGDKIHGEVKRLADSFTKKIEPPKRRIGSEHSAPGNGGVKAQTPSAHDR